METFQGESFHTSRWDYDVDLEGKRIGIIGTGATAVQAIPELAKVAGELYVFQRTPSTIDVRDQRATTEEEIEAWANEPGWARARRARFAKISAGRTAIQANDDYLAGKVADFKERKVHERRAVAGGADREAARRELPDHGADPRPRRRHRRGPEDGGGAEAVLPVRLQAARRSTTSTCRRSTCPTCTSSTPRRWACSEINERGVVHDGVRVPARRADLRHRLPVDGDVDVQHGRRPRRPLAQREVADARAPGRSSACTADGFPNLFIVTGPQGGGGSFNFTDAIDAPRRLRRVDAVRRCATAAHDDRRRRRRSRRRRTPSTAAEADIATAPLRDCLSYYNGHGDAEPGSLAYYGGGNWHKWRIQAQETMEPYVFGHATV